MSVRILQGDCRYMMAQLRTESIDAIVTDPPYHLTTGKKGGTGEASVNLESPYGRARITTGFMGKAWDGGDIAHDPAVWIAALRVAKPGAYLLAFGGTRTYHRLAVAIEDAGWEIRDQIGWAFGSGFPKSHNGPWGGTALKPAWEPICVARKPLIGTVEANWRAHGTGALNIDACRVDYAGTEDAAAAAAAAAEIRSKQTERNFEGWGMQAQNLTAEAYLAGPAGAGRWPANLIHDGSQEVLAAFPEAPGQQRSVGPEHGEKASVNTFGDYGPRDTFNPRGDAGSAARFFYCAKADRSDRNEGLEGLEGLVTDDGRKVPADNAYQRGKTLRKNHHPTVKPTDLMRYLCRLVTPKGGTVLDPFMGSGSTLKAAELEGFSAIGIEIDQEYCEIARRRIASDAPLFAEVS